ncbi:MAG: peptidoglycan-binding protein [Butyrivibrio sp.]|nr:peptidoglycan-binding protein [Butyrivibrio sp.]
MNLQRGDNSNTVKYLQQGLRMLCFNPNGLDGIFGPGTENAVKRFQSMYGLVPTGVVDDATWNMLKNQIIPIQQGLINAGYNIGSADGVAGEKTYNGILDFQRDNGLTADGMVGEQTKAKLYASFTPVVNDDNKKVDDIPADDQTLGEFSGDIVKFTIDVIMKAGGDYTFVDPDEAVSIGILQWSEENAHDLLELMYDVGRATVEDILGKDSELVKDIKQDRKVFIGRHLSDAERAAMQELLGSEFGRKAQYDKAINDVNRFIDAGEMRGIVDDRALIYFANLYNSSPKKALDILGAVSGKVTLDSLHKAATDKYTEGINQVYNAASKFGASDSVLEKFVNIALAEYGYKEQGENLTKYGEWFGYNGVAWCAIFVSWCAYQAGILRSSANPDGLVPKYDAVTAGMNDYIARGRFKYKESYTPKYGDIMFLKSAGASHTAIVVGYDKATRKVYTIEGNFSDKVCKVWRYADFNKITGYGVNGGTFDGYALDDAIPAE